MIVDANILIYAGLPKAPFHDRCRRWLEQALNGPNPNRRAMGVALGVPARRYERQGRRASAFA